MAKLDFEKPLLWFDGQVVKDPDGNDILLSTILKNVWSLDAKNPDFIKMVGWGLQLSSKKKEERILDLDKSDQDLFRKYIKKLQERDEQFMTGIQAFRIIEVLDEAKK